MKERITPRTCLGYMAIMTLANLVGAAAMLLVSYFFSKSNDVELIRRHYILSSLLTAAIQMAATALITGIYFHRTMPDLLPPDDDTSRSDILKHFCRLVLPGEMIRTVLCSLPTKPGMMFGYRFFDGFFALAPNYLWDMFYVIPNNRLGDMREFGYSAADTLVFLAFYVVCLAVLLTAYFWIFRAVWKTAEATRKSQVKLRMDPEQMK